MQERPIELAQIIEQEGSTEAEPIVEVLGQIKELNIGKRQNIDRSFRPID